MTPPSISHLGDHRALRVTVWWIAEIATIVACGGALSVSLTSRVYAGFCVLFVVWFAFNQMHTSVGLESRALRGANSPEVHGARRRVVVRLLLFYFVVLSAGIVGLWLQSRVNTIKLRDDSTLFVAIVFVPIAIRVVCLQRRYLRLRGEELEELR